VSAVEAPLPLEAAEPAEVRGEGRDDVGLLVATRHDLELTHARFRELPRFLSAGDLLVVNTSATLPAALEANLGGQPVQLWLSTPNEDGTWLVELRTSGRRSFARPPLPVRVELPGGIQAELLAPFAGSDRLSVARLETKQAAEDYLRRYGRPIRYDYVPEPWPLAAYTTVFAREPGSAEMPSAGRPFTEQLVTELLVRGVLVAPVLLHTGVSSLEQGERPLPERFRVPAATARLANAVHGWNGRVIAVGTTVARALETVAADDGTLSEVQGWTSLLITPQRGISAVDGLLTGWHEPASSHLQLLGRCRPRAPRALVQRRARAWLPLARVRRSPSDPALMRGVVA
jgi:S-adenosylmethionine:tRNA ribosyltransferase-isomerase